MDEKTREGNRLRQQARRDRLKEAALQEVRGIIAPVRLHGKIKQAASKVIERDEKKPE